MAGYAVEDIDDNRLLPPDDGIPYVGHLANDSKCDATANCTLKDAPFPNAEAALSSNKRRRRYGLFVTRRIAAGDELLWNYGEAYPRSY